MKAVIRRMGNSHGVIIPKPMLTQLGARPNDPVEMRVKNGALVISPVNGDPRTAWAAECKALAEAGEDGLVWPEFGNKDDDDLVW